MASLELHHVPTRLAQELEAWARLRRATVETAATELLRIGLETMSEKNQHLVERSFTVHPAHRQGAKVACLVTERYLLVSPSVQEPGGKVVALDVMMNMVNGEPRKICRLLVDADTLLGALKPAAL